MANPLLIWAVVAGAHNEALSVMFAVAGMLFMRKNPFLAGVGIGLAGCVKLSIGLWGLAMLWAYRREPKKALLLCAGTAIPMGAGVRGLAAGRLLPGAAQRRLRLGRLLGATRSSGSSTCSSTGLNAKIVVGVISYAGLVVIAWMLSRVVPWTAVPGLPRGADLRQDPLTIALRTSLVLSVAWLITSMYTLSWYDLIAWVPLAVLATSKLDRIMLIRIAPLSLAYVPGRAIEYGPALDVHRRPGAGTPSRRSSRSPCCWPWCCGGGSPTGPSCFPSAAPASTTAEPVASPAKPTPATVRRATARRPPRPRSQASRPPAPARSGSRRR